MKITNFLFLVLILLFFASCSSMPKADKAKVATPGLHAEYTDWQGAAFGATIPEWVATVVTAGSEDELRKHLNKPEGYRVWAVMARGEDFDALKMLTDNFDIQTQVGASISQNVSQIADRVQQAEGTTSEAKITEQTAKVVNMINMNLTLNGLERITSYWTKYYMADKNGNPASGDSGKELYSYVVVMGMEGDNFTKQLNAAMKKIEENTAEDDYLRKLSDIVIADLKKPELLTGSIAADVNITNSKAESPTENKSPDNVSNIVSPANSGWDLKKIRNDHEGCTVYTFSFVSPESCRIIVGLKLADNPMKSRAYCGISDIYGNVVANSSNGQTVKKNYANYANDYWYLNGRDGDYYVCNHPEDRDTTRWLFDLCLANDTVTMKTDNGKTATFITSGLKKAIEDAGITIRDITEAFANGKI